MSLIRRCNCDMNTLLDRNTINQTLKFIGLLAILPLVMVAIVPDYIGEADAYESEENISYTSNFPIELVPEEPSITPIIGIIGIER